MRSTSNSILRGARAKWNSFWFAPGPAYSMAAFRILFGFYLLCYFLSFATKVNLLFSNEGIYIPYLVGDLALPPIAATTLYVFTLLVIGSFTIGYRTRVITPLLLGLYLYFCVLNLAVKNSAYDRLNLIFLFILCFADLNRVWSVRSRPPMPQPDHRRVSVWAIRLITIQVGFLYFGAGLWKLFSPHWHTGEMMHWTLIGPYGTPLAYWFANLNPPIWLYTALTWSVIAFELTMPVALFIRPLQRYAFLAGILFHGAIGVLLNIPEFLNCVVTYVLFINPETVRVYGKAAFRNTSGLFSRLSEQ